jgi:tetratricopeptide (TPR) repeat protein
MNETQPTNISSKPNRLISWIVFAIAIVLVIAGALFGASAGVSARKNLAATQVEQALGEQFKMSQDDLAAERYDVASQRLTWILEKNPQYPGAAELLTEVLVKQAATATPTVTPTPDISPTPDLRGVEELFNQATTKLAAGDWDGAQADLDMLRKNNPDYKTVLVDGMYYNLLRSRGVSKIAPPSGQAPNLEGGIYDLTLAEHFGPLDNYSAGLRNFSRYYLTGASFWELDWEQAYYYFSQVAPALLMRLPDLPISCGMMENPAKQGIYY